MSTLAVNSITDANAGNTATINGMTPTADSLQGFRNRIINGDMRIDQRNAGASVTINSTSNTFTLDRWAGAGQNTDGVFTIQQLTSTPPTGFTHFLRVTTTTADASIGASQLYVFRHAIEGNNVSDLGFGTANAKQITLSFWVRSSLTGTFGGSLANDASSRFYVFSFSISVANTWEYKTITLTGDTSGTWETGTSVGIKMFLSLGAGSTVSGTAGSWGSTAYYGVTSGVNVIGTLNATFDITGVQLEVGGVATSFERRPYGTELNLCQRYYQEIVRDNAYWGVGAVVSTANVRGPMIRFLQTMRAAPTVTLPAAGTLSGQAAYLNNTDGYPSTVGTLTTNAITTQEFTITGSGFTSSFTTGDASNLWGTGSTKLTISAEL